SFELQARLKQLMMLSPSSVLVITDFPVPDLRAYRLLSPEHLLAQADRPDLRQAQLEETGYRKAVDLEKARRIPDITLKAQYDRNGNTMLNFFGVGASIDLPLFNRNQGNIQYARINAEKAGMRVQEQSLHVNTEIIQA